MSAARRNPRGARKEPVSRPTVLVLGVARDAARPFPELRARKDLRIVWAWGPEKARSVVEREGPAVALAAPEVPAEWVDEVVSAVRRHRPGTPVLALRDGGAELPESWRGCVGVLRCPLLPLALTRSIDVVLQLVSPKPGAA